jgi:alkylhydroperoxidase/carboxymuconolactone decarboxylase family protein YurZ
MALDARTTLLVQISAAAATNSLAALRSAVTDAKSLGVTSEEIQKTVSLAIEIQEQPVSHTRHLVSQLLREPVRKTEDKKDSVHHNHGPGCNCHQ